VFTTYSELQEAVANWLDRDDLEDRIPDFIALAEAKMRRRLRRKVVRASLTLDDAEVSLPATLEELRSIWLVNDSEPTKGWPLRVVTPEVLAEKRQAYHVADTPRFASVVDGVLLLVPEPSGDYDAEIVYFEKLVALSDAAPVNSMLTEAPDMYLYGALAEAAPYLEHDERVGLWQGEFAKAIVELNTDRQNKEFGASLRPVRLPVILG
jgi:hypothetical protein